MNFVAALALTGVGISLAYYAFASIVAVRFSIRAMSPAPPLPKIAPRVALLKPLYGENPDLARNLSSCMELDYPRLEYVFGVAGYDDPAAVLPAALKSQYRFAHSTLVVGEEPGCSNRKVAKLFRMIERAPRADAIVVADADVAVERDHLRRVIGELYSDSKVGVVSCIYRSRPAVHTLASRLDSLAVNTDVSALVMVSAAIEPVRYALGATMAIKREALDEIGGFGALKDVLADDFFLGKLATDHGYEARISSSIVTVTSEEQTITDFWRHQLRWVRTYRTSRSLSLATILLHGPFWAIVFTIASRFSAFSLGALAAVLLVRTSMAWLMISRVLRLPELRRDAWLTTLKDLLMTAVWFVSLTSNRVVWGGRRLVILDDGTMREVSG